jgi:hypothetical protein
MRAILEAANGKHDVSMLVKVLVVRHLSLHDVLVSLLELRSAQSGSRLHLCWCVAEHNVPPTFVGPCFGQVSCPGADRSPARMCMLQKTLDFEKQLSMR